MASLPSGYTKLEYIESSGTQYIDTGVSNFPTQSTRVILDVDWLSGLGCYFGCSQSEIRWFVEALQPAKIYSGYLDKGKSADISTVIGRYTVDKNGIYTNVNGVKIQHVSASNTASKSIYLLACNGSSGVSSIADAARIYSCKIYSGSALIRQFVPCKNSSGEVGLYDEVNDVFYGNAGTGVFIAGPEVPISGSGGGGKHKTLIAGTSYGIKSGRTLIGGTGYDIKKGRTLIGGTGYDISLGTPIGELAGGTSVFMNVNGERTEFIVVHQGNPNPAIYDASCDGTWLLMKDIYTTMSMNYSSTGYKNSNVHSYLNGEFLGLLEMNVQNAIKQVKIPYRDGDGHAAIKTGANGLLAKIFLLSASELGENYFGEDGATLDYFKDAQTNDSKLKAYYNGELSGWQLRSTTYSATYQSNWTAHVNVNRYNEVSIIGSVYGDEEVRPALIVPQNDVIIDDNFNIIPV